MVLLAIAQVKLYHKYPRQQGRQQGCSWLHKRREIRTQTADREGQVLWGCGGGAGGNEEASFEPRLSNEDGRIDTDNASAA